MDFEALANEHKDAVYRQMVRVCGNQADAEDVLIEALLKAYRNLGQLRESAAFRGWLAQIARRVCWQIKNQEALRPVLQLSALEQDGHQIPAPGGEMETRLQMRQMRKMLHDAIAALPEEYREVYVLRDIDEVPGEEAARRLGLTIANMKSRLHRARALLRERLDGALTARG